MPEKENSATLEILLQTLKQNPDLWETRRQTAEILFNDEQFLEAADLLWNAPEIPSIADDLAFAIKIISRAKPNRAIRMIYEVITRNNDKPVENVAIAKALNDTGLHMQAARFYGAALASDPSLFDLGFERQALWMDDSNRFTKDWEKSDTEFKPAFAFVNQVSPPAPASVAAEPVPMAAPQPPKRVLTPAPMRPSPEELGAASTPSTATTSAAAPIRQTFTNKVSESTPAEQNKPSVSVPAETTEPTVSSTPVPAVAVPTQPLAEVSSALAKPAEKSDADLVEADVKPEEPEVKLQVAEAPVLDPKAQDRAKKTSKLTLGSTTGKLLTPSVSDKPPAKLK